MLIKLKGIIISETNYSETSKIINILTSEYGKIGVMAKGVRNIKNPLRSVCQKLTYGEFTIKYKEKGLSSLIDATIIDSLKNISKDFKKAAYSFYIVDLFNQVLNDDSMSNNYDEKLFNLLESALLKINSNLEPMFISNIVELQLLKFLGVSLELNKCVNCGKKDNIITIDLELGGMLCKECFKDISLLSAKSIKLIRLMYYVSLEKLDNINIEDQTIVKEINNFIRDYYNKYTGMYLKNKDNIEKLLVNLT